MTDQLRGIQVIVAGAGLAGLAAAAALEEAEADVTLIDARHRVGGRVWTLREGFTSDQHAEAGGDLIESGQTALLTWTRALGLRTVRILRGGFGFYGANPRGRLAIERVSRTFAAIEGPLHELVRQYRLGERRWDGAIAAALARTSVRAWLDDIGAPRTLIERVRGLRGLLLADPEDLSLLALVDFFADESAPPHGLQRIRGGNDRLATVAAGRLRTPPRLNTVLRRIRQRGDSITATVDTPSGTAEHTADFIVCAMPTTTLRDVHIEPALPEMQRTAIAHLRYGAATRLLLQFERRFWRRRGRPLAFGSSEPTGAVWDGNEEQRGPGILSCLAGGRASAELTALLESKGPDAVARQLRWLGRPSPVLHARPITWEHDPWAGGGYAYFDPAFDPAWRDTLARPAGRLVFAGEHTSVRWQGYMNGAIESGQRAAAEVTALAGATLR